MSSQDQIVQCGRLLKELEQLVWDGTPHYDYKHYTTTVKYRRRRRTRTKKVKRCRKTRRYERNSTELESQKMWVKEVESAVSTTRLGELYKPARKLEESVQVSRKDEWKNWKRTLWLALFGDESDGGVVLTASCTQFARCLQFLEGSFEWQLSDEVHARQKKWLKEVESLIYPPDDALFASYFIEQIEKCIDGVPIEQWGRNVDSAISKLRECADDLDKVARDTGIARATGGAAAVLGGVAVIGGLVAAPFTGGASAAAGFAAGAALTATIGGTAVAAAGGLTALGASLAKLGWDISKTNEAEEVTKEVCRHSQILQECVKLYKEIIQNFKSFLDTPEGQQFVKDKLSLFKDMNKNDVTLEAVLVGGKGGGSTVSTLLAAKKIPEAIRLLRIVNALRPDLIVKGVNISGPLASKLAVQGAASGIQFGRYTIVVAGSLTAKVLGALGGVASIGFGAWDVFKGAQQIANGSDIAVRFRQLATDLKTTKEYITSVLVKDT